MSKNPSLKPGSKLGPYEILELIGKGGMGEVYQAYEESLDRKVAIKIIPKDLADKDPEVVKRFDAEGKVLAQLSHPNVVVVHSLGQFEGIHFMSMEFVDGPSLKERIRDRTFELSEAIPLFLQMLQGTEALHRSGVIHRDLKPANVIYKRDGTIKIVDMGIAKNTEDTNPEITKVGEVVGSPMYMSPEVACGEPATRQSDIWGLGLIFYEMLVGKNPFKGNTQAAILKKITTTDLDFPKEFYVKYPIDIIKAIKKMCSRNSSTRYSSTAEAFHDFEVIAERFNRKDFASEKTSFGQKLTHTSSKTVPIYQQTRPQTTSMSTSGVSRTRTVQSRSQRTYQNEDNDESQLKIYSLLYLAAAAVGIVLFLKYKDKIGGDVPDVKPVPGTEETSASKRQPIAITVRSPQEGKILWAAKNNLVSIDYLVSGTPGNFKIQIAADAMFANVIVDKFSPARPFQTTELEPERIYYLRFINQVGNSNSYSDTISFLVSTRLPPALSLPADDAKFSISNPILNEFPVNFEWKRKVAIDRYRIQVAKDVGFSRIIMDKSVAGNNLTNAPIPVGNYFWRVRAVGDSPVSEFWSSVQNFSISKAAAPTPQVQAPAYVPKSIEKASLKPPQLDKSRIPTTLINRGNSRNPSSYSPSSVPAISWSKVRGASNYAIQIASDSGFTNLIVDTNVSKNSYRWQDVAPGVHYYRVFARSNDGAVSASSSTGQVEAIFAAPEMDSSFKMIDKNDKYFAKVKWRKNSHARGYVVKVSDNQSFTGNVKTLKADEEVLEIELENSRRHFVKVAAVNESGEPISQYSKASSITFDRQPAAISLESPRINVPSDGTALAATPSATSPVVFEWQNANKATAYQIQISRDPDFTEVIFSTRVKENLLVFDKRLPPGKIYWRLRSERDKASSTWTGPRSIDVPGRSE